MLISCEHHSESIPIKATVPDPATASVAVEVPTGAPPERMWDGPAVSGERATMDALAVAIQLRF